MPHVIVKLWPRKNEAQEEGRLAEAITRDVPAILSYGDESVSVEIEEVDAERCRDDVYIPDIIN